MIVTTAAIIASFAIVTTMFLNGITTNINITKAISIATNTISILAIVRISIIARELTGTTTF